MASRTTYPSQPLGLPGTRVSYTPFMGGSGPGTVIATQSRRIHADRALTSDFAQAAPERLPLQATVLPPRASPALLLPPDLLPTVIQWTGLGIIGAIAIVVLAQVGGAVQEELR